MEKALIAMSGGVDSSVAALLAREQGWECIGCTMRLYDGADAGVPAERGCCSLDDTEDARSVAYRLGMPFYAFNYTADFRSQVIEPFVAAYRRGLTPNPCIECNRTMKFDRLLRRARELGCTRLVTGHYARTALEDGRWTLKKALDPRRDQSYVLYMLTQEQLEMVRFPLGELTKPQVRAIAEEHGFVNASKPDSQDICFVPDGDYAKVIETYTGNVPEPGNFVDKAGKVIGPNKGIIHYTIGQRKGLGISAPEPLYVCEIRPKTREVVLGSNDDLMSRELTVADFNWISGSAPTEPFRCKAKIRYRQKEQWAEVAPIGEDRVRILFDEPQRAITPGQSAVAYDGDEVLGGGIIS